MSDSADAAANEAAAHDSPGASPATAPAGKSMPSWFIAGILGVLIGGVGGFLLAVYGYGHGVKVIRTPVNAGENYGKPPMMDVEAEQAPIDVNAEQAP